MLKKILPFVLVAMALSVVFALLFATIRMGNVHPSLEWVTKRRTGLPIEPIEPVEPEGAA